MAMEIRGTLTKRGTLAPVVDARVVPIVNVKNDEAQLAPATTKEDGRFLASLDDRQWEQFLAADAKAYVFFRIYIGKDTKPVTDTHTTLQLPLGKGIFEVGIEVAVSSPRTVQGAVWTSDHKPAIGLTIEIRQFVQNASGAVLGTTIVRTGGDYLASYNADALLSAGRQFIAIYLVVYNDSDKKILLGSSNPVFNAPPEARLDFVLPAPITEFESTSSKLDPFLKGRLLRDLSENEIAELSKQVGVALDQVKLLASADELSSELGLPQVLLFASLRGASGPSLDNLLSASEDSIRKTIQNSFGTVIPALDAAVVDAAIAKFKALRVQRLPLAEVGPTIGLERTDPIFSALAGKNIRTLGEVRNAGGLQFVQDLGLKPDNPSLQKLEAHARLLALSNDIATNETLIGKGYTTISSIARSTPNEMAVALGDAPNSPRAAALHSTAKLQNAFLQNVATDFQSVQTAGLLQSVEDWRRDHPIRQVLVPRCECDDCDAAVSPRAYLADLMQYAIDHLRNSGQKIDLNFFEDNFRQPFSQLPASCAAEDETVRQVRIVIEVLRRYLGNRPLTPAARETALAQAERAYRVEAYTQLLTKLGTSFTEIRLARGMSTDELTQLADGLGVPVNALSSLFVDPDATPSQLTEARLEQLFGLRDTTQPPIRSVPTSSVGTWRAAHLRTLWQQEDFPSDLFFERQRPIIDPDLLGPDDFRAPVMKNAAAAPNRAFDLWRMRRAWADSVLDRLRSVPLRQSGTVSGRDFPAIVAAMGDRAYQGQAPQWPANAVTTIQSRVAAVTDATSDAISQELFNNYGLILPAARRFVELWGKDAAFWKNVNRAVKVEEAEWSEVFSLLLKSLKNALINFWITEENDSVLARVQDGELIKTWTNDNQASQDLLGWREFWTPLRKPLEGDWPPTRTQGLPLIDPEIVKRQDLPDPTAGIRALALWDQRSAELGQKRIDLRTAFDNSGFDNMVEAALGPLPIGQASWTAYLRSLESALIGTDQTAADTASQAIVSNLKLTRDGFERLITVMETFLSTTATVLPSAADWGDVIALLSTAWKLRQKYAAWYAAETDATTGVEPWRCARQSLATWRTSIEERQAWDQAFRQRTAPPTIDPDLLASTGYLVTPGVGEAWTIWDARGKALATKFTALQSAGAGANRTAATLTSVTDTELGPGALAELASAQTAGASIAPRLEQLQLSYAALNELLRVQRVLNVTPVQPVLDSEWNNVSSILVDVWKQRLFADWRIEERAKSVVLSQDFFRPLPIDTNTFPPPPPPQLDSWRASSNDLLDWLDKLQSRMDQEQEMNLALEDAVSSVEEDALPALRDALVAAAYPAGLTNAPTGRWLGNRLAIATEYGGCQKTTRISQAIETFQIILWGVRTGILSDVYPNLKLEADDFDEEWKWIGSYATWRSAMFVFLYPENLLIPSLRHFQTPGFQTLIDTLRNTPRVTQQIARQVAHTYDEYFRDICSLSLIKQASTSVLVEGVQHDLVFYFGIGGETGGLYWAVNDDRDPMNYRPTAWNRLTSINPPFQISDCFVYSVRGVHRYLYLFAIMEKEGANELAFVRYDLARYPTDNWPETVTKLSPPPNATTFTAEVMERVGSPEAAPIRIRFRLNDGVLYERELTVEGDDWGPGDWNAIDRYWSPWINSGIGPGTISPSSKLAAVVSDTYDSVVALFGIGSAGTPVLAQWNDYFLDPQTKISSFTTVPPPANPISVDPGTPIVVGPPQFSDGAPVTGIRRPGPEIAFFITDSAGHIYEASHKLGSGWNWAAAGGEGGNGGLEPIFTASARIAPSVVSLAPNYRKFRIFALRDPNDLLANSANYVPDNSFTSLWSNLNNPKWNHWVDTNGLPNPNKKIYHPIDFEMAAISRKRDRIDIFAVGPDQLLYWNSSDDEGVSWGFWTLVPNSITIPSGSRLLLLSESPDSLLLAVVDDNGLCQSIGFNSQSKENDGWSNWTQIGGSGTRLMSGSTLTGFLVGEQHLFLIALGQDKQIYSTWRSSGQDEDKWHHWTSVGWDAPNAVSLAVVARTDASQTALQVLLFALTENGEVAWTTSQENLGAAPAKYSASPFVPSVSNLAQLTPGEVLSDTERQLRQSIIDSAYANNWAVSESVRAYLEEAFYFVPVHIALQLEKSGAYQSALDWFRLAYDYTAPSTSRQLLGLPKDTGSTGYQRNVATWLLDPLNPHAIAATRAKTYTRFTLLAIIGCLLDYADNEFTADTSETVPRARELYERVLELLASNDLRQSTETCDQAIGNLEITVDDPHWEWVTTYVKTALKGISVLASIKKAGSDVQAAIAGKVPWAERFANVKKILSDAAPKEVAVPQFRQKLAQSKTRAPELESAILAKSEVSLALDRVLSGEYEIASRQSPPALSMAKSSSTDLVTVSPTGTRPRPTLMTTAAFDFCIPPNPLLQTLSLRAGLNRYKILNCRNIAGMERELEPFAAATDTSSGMPAIGANGQIVLAPTTQPQPTPYRYSVVIDRAKQLAQQAVQFEAAFLSALEKSDKEAFDLLNARANVRLAQAGVRLQDLRVTEARDGVKSAELQRGRASIQAKTYEDWLNAGLSPAELSLLGWYDWLAVFQVVSVNLAALMQGITGGISIAAATGPFGVAAQVAYQAANTGKALADSLGINAQREISRLNVLISHERNVQEWSLQKSLADQDVKIGEQQVLIANDGVGVAEQERAIEQMKADQAKDVLNFLTNKFTNKELYDWMSGVLQKVYSFFLQQATSMAQVAQAQLGFERQETAPRYIQDDYWQPPSNDSTSANQTNASDRRGLTGSARLLQDIYQLDQYAFNTNKRKQQLTKTISMVQLDPIAFQRFLETGVLPFATKMEVFDRDFPGHYLRLIKRVRTTVVALIPPNQGIRATLASTGLSRVVTGGDTFQTAIIRRAPESIALSAPVNSTGLFDLQDQGDMLLPFEGSGVATSWEFRLPKPANQFDFSTIADVLVTMDYTALSSFDYQQLVLQQLNAKRTISSDRAFSFRNQFADAWYDLNNPDQSDTPMTVEFETVLGDFPPSLDNTKIQNVALYLAPGNGSKVEIDGVQLQLAQPGGGSLGGVCRSENGLISTRAANGTGWLSLRDAQPAGTWKLALPNNEQTRNLFAGKEIKDMLFVVTFGGRLPEWPS